MFFDREVKKFIQSRKFLSLKNCLVLLLLFFLRQVIVQNKTVGMIFQKTNIGLTNKNNNVYQKLPKKELTNKLPLNYITDNYKRPIEKAILKETFEKINEKHMSNYETISENGGTTYFEKNKNYGYLTLVNEAFINTIPQPIGEGWSNRRRIVDPIAPNDRLDKVTIQDEKTSKLNCLEHLLNVPESLKKLKDCTECSKVKCRDILYSHPRNNISYYLKVQALMKRYEKFFNNNTQTKIFELLDSDCEEYKAWRNYDLSAPSEEELEDTPYSDLSEYFKNFYIFQESTFMENTSRKAYSIAYNILVHDNFKQAESLLRGIYRPQHFYCIHVDNKNTVLVNQIKKLTACFSNVYLASKLEKVIYQSFSRLQADLNCMQDHLARNNHWKYLINTAASAYPLKTSLELVQVLKIYNGTNNIGMINTKNNDFLEKRFKKVHRVVTKGNITKVVRYSRDHPPPPHNLTIVKGNAYGVFSREFVHFILTNKIAKDFLNWCKDTFSPDEHYWNTLHHTFSNPHVHAPGGFNGISSL